MLLTTEPSAPPPCLESGSLIASARLTGLHSPGILLCLPPTPAGITGAGWPCLCGCWKSRLRTLVWASPSTDLATLPVLKMKGCVCTEFAVRKTFVTLILLCEWSECARALRHTPDVRGQLAGVSSPPPTNGTHGLKSGVRLGSECLHPRSHLTSLKIKLQWHPATSVFFSSYPWLISL